MFIGSMLNTFVVDLLVDEEEVNSSTSYQKASSSKLDTLTHSKLSQKPKEKPAAKSRQGSVVDVSELGPFDVLSGRGREVSRGEVSCGQQHLSLCVCMYVGCVLFTI